MSTLTGNILSGADDYEEGDGASSTNTTISAFDFDGGASNRRGYVNIDASSLPADATITQVDFHYYHDGYTKVGKSTTYVRVVGFFNSVLEYTTILNTTATPPIAQWEKITITNATELADIETVIGSDGELNFRFTVGSAQSTGSRNWEIRSYEYDGVGGVAAYIVIEYTTGSTTRRRAIIIS